MKKIILFFFIVLSIAKVNAAAGKVSSSYASEKNCSGIHAITFNDDKGKKFRFKTFAKKKLNLRISKRKIEKKNHFPGIGCGIFGFLNDIGGSAMQIVLALILSCLLILLIMWLCNPLFLLLA
jgi:hypothetical protein